MYVFTVEVRCLLPNVINEYFIVQQWQLNWFELN